MSFADKVKKFAGDTFEKGKGLAEQGKLALENQKQEETIKSAKALIGSYVVDNALLTDDEYVASQLGVIEVAMEVIEKNKARVAELKAADEAAAEAPVAAEPVPEAAAAKRFCPSCGMELDANARFCPSCGAKL